jgi:hypothetical protein
MTALSRPLCTRWSTEVQDLRALKERAGGRFDFAETAAGVRCEMEVRAPLRAPDGEIEIAVNRHPIELRRTEHWPAEPPVAIHQRPDLIWHPNILSQARQEGPLTSPRDVGLWLFRGAICYRGRSSVQPRLVDIVTQIYEMLGFRWGRYSRLTTDVWNVEAVRWVTWADARGLLPTETRPLAVGGAP